MLRGLAEFREHLGGRLTVMLLARNRPDVRRARNRPGRYDPEYRDWSRAPGSSAAAHVRSRRTRAAWWAPSPHRAAHDRRDPAQIVPLTATQLVDEYFIENRNRLIEIAAFLDRLDRADPAVRCQRFPDAARSPTRVAACCGPASQLAMRRGYPDAAERPDDRAARRARSRRRGHRHLRSSLRARGGHESTSTITLTWSRGPPTTTQQMALTGCVAVTEPAFWAGWDRSTADGVRGLLPAADGVRAEARRAVPASSTTRGSA